MKQNKQLSKRYETLLIISNHGKKIFKTYFKGSTVSTTALANFLIKRPD